VWGRRRRVLVRWRGSGDAGADRRGGVLVSGVFGAGDCGAGGAMSGKTSEPLIECGGRKWGMMYGSVCVVIIASAAFAEWCMGRTPLSKSGKILFWVSDVNGPENSQQLLDWYSFSHVIHGMLLYCGLRWVMRGRSIGARFTLAVLLEAGWEVLENSPIIINRYREATISLGYVGDSILNSMSDILCCTLGFFLARKLPVWWTVGLIVVMEVGVGWAIRDNLLLNVIMLIHPFEAIKHWQMGAGGG
jgi:hypothetical protein